MIAYNMVVKFDVWINEKFFEWRGKSHKNVTEFAAYIGVTRQVLEKWMTNKSVPSTQSLQKLAIHYPEVYGIMGLEPPDPLARFPEEVKESLGPVLGELQDALDGLAARGISADSPEGVRIFTKILESHGIKTSEKSG